MKTRDRILLVAVFAALINACTSTPSERLESPYELRFIPVQGDITLVYRPDTPRFPVFGNAVIVPVDGGVVLVDGGGSAAAVEQILEHIKANDLGPLKFVILSHWHSDHTVGIDLFTREYPAVEVISHPWTTRRIVERLMGGVKAMANNFDDKAIIARKELATGHVAGDLEKPEVSPMQRRRAEELIEDYETISAQKLLASAVVPKTSTTKMVLPVNGRRIEIMSLGCGNTPGDLVVWLPRSKVLIGGDILTHPVPFGFPPCPTEVISTTEKLLAFDFEKLVLGHGPIQTNREYGDKVLALQRHAVAEIYRLHNEGLSEEEIASSLDLSPYDNTITGGDAATDYFFDIWYRQQIVYRTMREIDSL